MEDPFYPTSIEIGSINGAYEFNAFAQGSAVGLQALQSLILEITCTDDLGNFDISGSAPILYITAADDPTFNGGTDIILDGAGVLSDSGGGTTDRVTFTVPKSLIPEVLGQYTKSRRGNSRIYTILEDGDSYIQLYTTVNILDTSFNQTGGSTSIPVVGTGLMDTGRVEGTLTVPPANVVNENWLVGVSATGDWATHDNEIATGTGSDWVFTSVIQGNFIYDFTDQVQKRYDGALWIDEIQITTAADVPNVPSGNLVATDVQAALNELQTELDVFTVADDSITNAKLAEVSSLTIKGRLTGGVGNPEDLSATQAKQVLLLQNVDNTSDAGKPVSTAQQTALDLKLDEADVTVAQFNADSFLGKALGATLLTPSNGHVPTYNSGTGEYDSVAGAGGGAAGIEFQLNFETDITSSEPASGGIKYNSATPGSVTVIRASATDANGVDINDRLSTIGAGDSFYTRVLSDVTKFLKVSVTTSVFVTTSYDITCTIVTAGVLPAGSDTMGIDPEIITVGGATGVSSFNGRTLAVMPSPSDYDSTDIADASTAGGPTTEDSFDAIVLNKMAIADYDAAAISEQLVGLTATQSMTNKTVNTVVLTGAGAGNLFLQDDGSYGTPAGGGDMATATYDAAAIAEQLVGLTATQSLTNKTINTVVLDSTGAATSYLDQTGSYSVPGGGGGGEANTASNVGGGQGVFYQKTGVDLEFKSVVSNNGTCNITSSTTEVDVEAAGLYQNIYIDAAAMVPRTTNGAEALTKEFATNDIMIDYLAYDSTTEEGAQFKMMIPDRWDGGTIKFKFYWDAAATASGTVIWGVSAGALSDSDAIDTALGTQITVTDTLLTVGDMHISPATAAVTIAGTPALGDMIIFQVVATTGGTIAVDQFLMGVGIQYNESDTPQVIW